MKNKVLSLIMAGDKLTANHVLSSAKDEYKSVLVIGYDHDGILDVRSTLDLNHADILWLVESFKAKLLNGDYSG